MFTVVTAVVRLGTWYKQVVLSLSAVWTFPAATKFQVNLRTGITF